MTNPVKGSHNRSFLRFRGTGNNKKSEHSQTNASSVIRGDSENARVEASFAGQLESNLDYSDQDPQEMLAKYDQLSQKLVRDPSAEELRKFRAFLQALLQKIQNSGYSLKKVKSRPQRFTSEIEHELVLIERKMQEISERILSRKNQALDLLKYVEDIRGMLVNLLS